MTTPPPIHHCAVCGFSLDSTPFGYFHGREVDRVDHLAVPVPGPGPNMRCDICDAEPVAWRLPATDFMQPLMGLTSVGDWMLCDICGGFAVDSDWLGLANRSVAIQAERRGEHPALERILRESVDLLRRHVTGPPEAVSR